MANFIQADVSIWARALCAKAKQDVSEIDTSRQRSPVEGQKRWHAQLCRWLDQLPDDTVPLVLAIAEPSIAAQLDIAPEALHERVLRHNLPHSSGITHLAEPAAVLSRYPTAMAAVASSIQSLTILGDQAPAHSGNVNDNVIPDSLEMLTSLQRLTVLECLPDLAWPSSLQLSLVTHMELRLDKSIDSPSVTTSLKDVVWPPLLRSLRLDHVDLLAFIECAAALRALPDLTSLALGALAQFAFGIPELGDALTSLPLVSLELFGMFFTGALWQSRLPQQLTRLELQRRFGLGVEAGTALRIPELTALQFLHFPAAPPPLEGIAAAPSRLSHLDISGAYTANRPHDQIIPVSALPPRPTLRALRLHAVIVSADSTAVSALSNLTSLSLVHCQLFSHCAAVAQALKQLTSLRALELADHSPGVTFTRPIPTDLLAAVSGMTQLRALVLVNTNFRTETISGVLSTLTGLTALDLQCSARVSSVERRSPLCALFDAVACAPSMVTLRLRLCGPDSCSNPEAATVLRSVAGMLRALTALEVLRLSATALLGQACGSARAPATCGEAGREASAAAEASAEAGADARAAAEASTAAETGARAGHGAEASARAGHYRNGARAGYGAEASPGARAGFGAEARPWLWGRAPGLAMGPRPALRLGLMRDLAVLVAAYVCTESGWYPTDLSTTNCK